jgi:hypothetical protein
MKWIGTLLCVVVLSQYGWTNQPHSDPAYDKLKSAVQAKLYGKKYFAAYKASNKALIKYPKDGFFLYSKAFGMFYSEKNKKVKAKYPTKDKLILATFNLLKEADLTKVGEFNKGFSTRLQRGAMKEVTKALKKNDAQSAIAILDPWFTCFNNSTDYLKNKHEDDVQDTLFGRGKIAYLNDDFSLAEAYFNWMDKTFNQDNFTNKYDATTIVPVEGYIFDVYRNPMYFIAHTAKDISSLKELEKQVIFFHNLIRMDPPLFDETFVEKYMNDRPSLAKMDHGVTLRTDLQEKGRLPLLFFDEKLYQAAEWHAIDTGEKGITGHVSSDGSKFRDRMKKFGASGRAENCSYGRNGAYEIMMGLMVDLYSETKGHRRNILFSTFKRIGVASRPHKGYGSNIVMDYGD